MPDINHHVLNARAIKELIKIIFIIFSHLIEHVGIVIHFPPGATELKLKSAIFQSVFNFL